MQEGYNVQGMYKEMNTKKWELLGTILDTGYQKDHIFGIA